jgi:hypothetical protein
MFIVSSSVFCVSRFLEREKQKMYREPFLKIRFPYICNTTKQLLMKKTIIFATLISSVGIMAQNKITYPKTKKIDHKDVYFNTEVTDAYRWLEDDRSEETENWVKAENVVTLSINTPEVI